MSSRPQDGARRRLGRGLSSLLGGGTPEPTLATPQETGELRHIAIDQISRNPWQPRKEFDAESLGELASSIKEHGLLQPVLLREIDGGFQLVAGERRWRACQQAGLTAIPARIVDVIDKTACEFALEENLKRKDLSDLEKAQAFRDYIQAFECSIEELGKQLSMSRSAVSNLIRLLDLTEPVQNALRAGRISTGHARALLPLDAAGQLEVCGRIAVESLNVRQTEKVVRQLLGREQTSTEEVAETSAQPTTAELYGPFPLSDSTEAEGDSFDDGSQTLSIQQAQLEFKTNHVRDLETQLRNIYGTPVEIRMTGKESGQIVLPFASNAEFERILWLARERAAG